jgi:hypothetical protein
MLDASLWSVAHPKLDDDLIAVVLGRGTTHAAEYFH